jgi:Predicted nucleic acid-binding protein, contains PIN domain
MLALELSNDQNHRAAVKHWRSLRKKMPPLVTTAYVFDEVVTYFDSRGYHAKAVEVGNRLLKSPSVQFVQVDEGVFREGWDYFQQHQDKDYSLTDCISFVVMRRFGLDTAFAFRSAIFVKQDSRESRKLW